MIYSERKEEDPQTKHISKINKNHSLEWVQPYNGMCESKAAADPEKGKKFYRKLETM